MSALRTHIARMRAYVYIDVARMLALRSHLGSRTLQLTLVENSACSRGCSHAESGLLWAPDIYIYIYIFAPDTYIYRERERERERER